MSAWSPTEENGSEQLASHLSGLSVEEAYAVTQQHRASVVAAGVNQYPNVNTPQRGGYYDAAAAQYTFYTSGGVDPSTYSPATAAAHQGPYGYAELAAPMQPATNHTFDPYSTPEPLYGVGVPPNVDTRIGGGFGALGGINGLGQHQQHQHHGQHQHNQYHHHQQQVGQQQQSQPQTPLGSFQQQATAAASARSRQIYRPPHLQQHPLSSNGGNQNQTGYYAYGDRAQYWGPPQQSGIFMSNNQRKKDGKHGLNSQHTQIRNTHQQQQGYPISEFTHAPFNMQSPMSPGFVPNTPAAGQFGMHHTPPNGNGFTAPFTLGHYGYAARQARRQADEAGTIRSQRLEEFRLRKSAKVELSEIYGNICEFAGDQHGSRFIQNKLENATLEEREKVFEEIMPNAYQLMTDVFGNYVIQKLFEHGDQIQKASLAKKMEGHVLQLSMQMYGCRVVQKALEHVFTEQREKLIAELDGHIIDCVKSANANHVVQRLISLDPPTSVTDTFVGHVQDLSMHPFGCRVLQKSFEVLQPERIRVLLDEMHGCSHQLMEDQFGNYVVQSVITTAQGKEYDRDKVVARIKGNVVKLCRHKFASNVVEKALKFASPDDKREIIGELVSDTAEGGTSKVSVLLRDAYGNFPVQTALTEAESDQREALLAIIVPLMPHLRHTPCGRRLESKIQEYESKGLLPPLTKTVSCSTTDSADPSSSMTSDGDMSGRIEDSSSMMTSVASPDAKSTASRGNATSPTTVDRVLDDLMVE